MLVSDVAQRVAPSRDIGQNWSIVVEGTTSSVLVQQFNDHSVRAWRAAELSFLN